MISRVARRLVTALGSLLVVSALVFVLIHAVTWELGAEEEGTLRRDREERRRALAELYHMDRPVAVRYGIWLTELARGDLGRSLRDGRPVAEALRRPFTVTLLLGSLSMATMVAISLPLGALGALRPRSWWDRLGSTTMLLLFAVPSFWAALLLQMTFAVRLGWLPLAGSGGLDREWMSLGERLADSARHLVLPVICMSYGGLAYLTRFVRSALLESAAFEAARASRARGAGPLRVLFHHGIRPAGLSLLTLAGFLLPSLVAGSVVVESVFAIPGLGRAFLTAISGRDVPTVMALTLLSSVATLAGVVGQDLLYAWVDPRVRRA